MIKKSSGKISTKNLIFVFLLMSCLFFGCKKDKSYVFESDRNSFVLGFDKSGEFHKWFYFSKDGFEPVERCDFAPVVTKGAWTEAIRISSANINGDVKNPKGYAIVNRLGLITFDDDEINFSKDVSVFQNRTAGNLVFVNNVPVFSVFKSAFFNNSISSSDYKKDDSQHYFLLQFDENTEVSYPLVNTTNLIEQKEAEVSDFVWNGDKWFCSVKYIENDRTKFDYVSFRPLDALLSITPANAKNNLLVEEITLQDFRNEKEILSFSKAPEKIKQLLKGFSARRPFFLEVQNAGGSGVRKYQNLTQDQMGKELQAKSILSKELTSVLFEDGTMYIQGNLCGKPLINGGKVLVLRLPKLPDGYVYSDYVITKNTLYAAWEETAFYETIRSGFIAVDLEKLLY